VIACRFPSQSPSRLCSANSPGYVHAHCMTDPIVTTDWHRMTFHPGVLREANQDGRLVIWLPAERSGRGQYWQRVSSRPPAAIRRSKGLCSVAATAIRTRKRGKTLCGRLLHCFRRVSDDHVWLLPNGETAEQCGERQTNLLLVWAEDEGQPVNEARIRKNWPQNVRLQTLGPGLFLLGAWWCPPPHGHHRLIPNPCR